MARTFHLIPKLVLIPVLLFVAASEPANAAPPVEVTTQAQYLQIVEPTLAQLEPLVVVVSPLSSPFNLMLIEAWRLTALTYLGALESRVDNAMAKAITTNTVKNVRIGVEPAIQGGRSLIAKLKTDLKWYEDEFGFLPSFEPTDPTDREYWNHYQAIRKALEEFQYTVTLANGETEARVLKEAEKTLEAQAESVTEGLVQVSNKLQKASYGLPSLQADMKYMAIRMEPMNQTIDGIQRMAEQLYIDEHSPRKQFRGIFTNKSKNLIFFLQVETLNVNGEYVLRADTRYPVPVYPNVSDETQESLQQMQIAPFGPRGANATWMPLKLQDKIIVRAATMGQIRDRIRFMVIKGKNVSPDLNSLSRGYYYLGYQAIRSDGANIVSRWYPVNESYSWHFSRGWGAGETANDPLLISTDGKSIRGFGPDLTFLNDRMEWILPSGFATAFELKLARAEVSGSADILKVGPTAGDRNTLTETGSGQFEMQLKTW